MKRVAPVLAAAASCVLLSTPAFGVNTATGPPPASDATPVPVHAGTTTTGIDVNLPEAAANRGTISGRLVDAKTKAAVTYDYVRIFTGTSRSASHLFPVDNGSFNVSVPASRKGYYVCFRADREDNSPARYASKCLRNANWDVTSPPSGAERIPIATGEHKSLGQIGLQRGAEIRGRVVNAANVRLGGVEVIVRSLSDPSFTERFTTRRTTGTYKADGLPASAKGWQICFRGYAARAVKGPTSARHYANKCYRNIRWHGGPVPKDVTPVKVAPGKTVAGVDAVLNSGAAISGTVTAARGGRPIARAAVAVFTASGQSFPGPHIRYAGTDSHGRYTVGGLPGKRRYRVCVDPTPKLRAPGQSYLGLCHGGARWRASAPVPKGARSVRAREGHTTQVNIALPQAAEIDGTITSSTGHPLVTAMVSVFTSSGKPAAYSGQPGGPHGRFHIVELAARTGGYIVCAQQRSYFSKSSKTSYRAPQCLGGIAWNGSDSTVPRDATRVHVRAGQRRGGITIALPAGGAITGHVRDLQSGDGLADEYIYLYDADGNLVQVNGANPGDDGYYRFDGLEPSERGYVVCFSGPFAAKSSGRQKKYRGQCYQQADWNH